MRRKSKKLQRFLSIFLSVIMIVTALPLDMISFLGLGAGKVQAASSVLNADDLSVTDSFATYTAFGDFTVLASASKNARIADFASSTRGYVQNAEKAFTNFVQLEGGGITVKDGVVVCGIKFTAPAGAKVTAYAALKSTDTGRKLKIFKATEGDTALGAEAAASTDDCTQTVTKYEFELAEAGDYYIGFSGSGGAIPYLEVAGAKPASKILNADDLSVTDSFATNTAFGDFTVLASASKNARIADFASSTRGYVQSTEKTFTNFVQIEGGGIGVSKDNVVTNGIKFTASAGAKVTAYAAVKKVEEGKSVKLKIFKATEGDTALGDEVAASIDDCTLTITKYEFDLTDAGDYYIGFSGQGGAIPYLEVSGESEPAALKEINVTVSDNGLLGETDKVFLTDGSDSIDVTGVNTATLKIGSSYRAVLNDASGNVLENKAAKVNGGDSVKIAEDTTAIEVTVETTVLTLTPTITGSELGEYKLVAVAGTDTYELKNGVGIVLPKNTSFNLKVVDAEGAEVPNWTAKVDGVTSFTTGTDETQAITVEVKNVSEIAVTPKISGKGLMGTNVLYITEKADAANSVAAQDGVAVSLKPNTTYVVSLKSAAGEAVTDMVVMVGASTEFTTGLDDMDLEVAVSTPSTKSTTWDFTDNSEKTKPEVGSLVDGTADAAGVGILYFDRGTSSGCTFDAKMLRFRPGVVLYLPIKDDTTKITYIQKCSQTNAGRPTYVGSTTSGYSVEMANTEQSVTINDISAFVAEVDGQRYIPIISGGDVKIATITLVEYNPVNSVTVSGTVDGAAAHGATSISFKNMDDDSEAIVEAEIAADNSYSAVLKRVNGETNYAATIAVVGWKIDDTDNKDKFTLTGNGTTATQNFTVVEAPTATVGGTFSGIPDSALDKGDLKVELVPDNKAMKPIVLELTKVSDGNYSYSGVVLDLDRPYTVRLTNADDYEVNDIIKIASTETGAVTRNITATLKAVYTVEGRFVTSDRKEADVTKITFKNVDTPDYSYTFDVTGGSYSVKLRAGKYITSVTSASYSAYDHVDVEASAVNNDVYLQGAVDTSKVAYKDTIVIGQDFPTIAEAVAYISRMTRTADQRVTIVLESNKVYREQLIIDTPNITIKGNGATITWYYGVGFSYYSAKLSADGKSAYYDEAYAVDKYTKATISQNPGHWGATVNLFSGAAGFRAEDLTFENSLNRYLTEEEIADGAAENTSAAITARNAAGIDVKSYNAKERACVLYIQADNTEYSNCKLLSRQDTLYTGDGTESSYFKNCFIEGTVDYICGDGDAVFDNCTLSMYGYTGSKYADYAGAIITANKAKAAHGYLFSGCKIVDAKAEGTGNTYAYVLSRAWDAGTVYWMNTLVESDKAVASDKPYLDMNANARDSHYYEYNTHLADGTKIDTSKRAEGYTGTILTDEQAAAVIMTDFFGDWNPSYYEGDFTVAVDSLDISIKKPVTEEAIDNSASTIKPGVTLGSVKWYVGNTEVTGKTFEGSTVYKAVVKADLAEGYTFAESVTANVAGAESVSAVVSADKKSATFTVTFGETAMGGYYEVELTSGLLKSKTYAGGMLSVLVDMPWNTNGYVKGTSNPKPNGGEIPTSGSAVKVVVPEDNGEGKTARMTITARASGKVFYLVEEQSDGSAKVIEQYTGGSVAEMKVFKFEHGKTYYFYATGSNMEISYLLVENRVLKRAAWKDVASPVITGASLSGNQAADNSIVYDSIDVKVKADISDNGADTLYIDMLDSKGAVAQTISSVKMVESADEEQSFKFVPDYSDTYTFIARIERAGESSQKSSAESNEVKFTLQMKAPVIDTITNKGLDNNKKGRLEIVWLPVAEAMSYEVAVTDSTGKTVFSTSTKKTEVMAEGLPYVAGQDNTVKVSIVAVGSYADDKGKLHEMKSEAAEKSVVVNGLNQRTWGFTAYGSSTSTANNYYSNRVDDANGDLDKVTVSSINGSGKVVPGSTDGLAYYYTKIDPSSENFTLTADVHVDSWKYSNAQDGFGIMVSDRIGINGKSEALWNNSYQLLASKVGYHWNPAVKADGSTRYTGAVTNATHDNETIFAYDMKLGVGATAKENVTLADVTAIAEGTSTMPSEFTTNTYPLDTCIPDYIMAKLYETGKITDGSSEAEVCAAYAQYTAPVAEGKNNKSYGEFNVVKNASNASANTMGEIEELMKEDFKLQIQRNNTGYVLRYLSNEATDDAADGKTVVSVEGKNYKVIGSRVFYDDDRNALTKIDKDYIYVGFFAARNATVTFSNIALTTIDPAKDAAAEARPAEIVDISDVIESSSSSNSEDYEFRFKSNREGTLSVYNKEAKAAVVESADVNAGKTYAVSTKLVEGSNTLEWSFVPNKEYKPGTYQTMSSYDTVSGNFAVSYKSISGNVIYVTADAKSNGKGTQDSPVDIYTAVTYAKKGQKISLAAGTYKLSRQLQIPYGHDGTADEMIVMEGQGAESTILDFSSMNDASAAFEIVGNYWHIKGLSVTGSYDGKDGIHLCGSYNTIELVNTYQNGNTGLQISRYGSFGRDLWPKYNTVLNCTSYLNYDAGFEDADGFAAKLTCGDGNRFVGCVAAYNADDGWDLFAKVQSGSIGAVTIEDCVAYKNGYLLGYAQTDESTGAITDYEVFTDKMHVSAKFGQTFLEAVEFKAGNGNGFKMGGDSMSGYHVLKDSISFMNKANGITSNSCPDIQIINAIAYNNEGSNVVLYTSNSGISTDFSVSGLLSFKDASVKSGYSEADSLKPQKDQSNAKLYQADDYYWTGSKSAVYSAGSATSETADIAKWIVSTDLAKTGISVSDNVFVRRTEKGGIDLGDFLKLTDAAKSGSKLADRSYDEVKSAVPELYVLAGAYKTIGDFRSKLAGLSTGWNSSYNFKYPNTTVASFAGTKVELEVVDGNGNDAGTVNVYFVEVKNVELALEDGVTMLCADPIKVNAKAVGNPEADLNDVALAGGKISYEFKENSKLGLSFTQDGSGVATLSRKADSKEGNATIAVTMTVSFDNGKKLTKTAKLKLTTLKEEVIFSYTVKGDASVADRTLGGTGVYADGIVISAAGAGFTLEGLKAKIGTTEYKDVQVSLDSSTAVSLKNGKFTAKAVDGVAMMTLSIKGAKYAAVKIPVMVRVENKPYVANISETTLDINRTDTVKFQVSNSYEGAEATAVRVAGVYNDANCKKEVAGYAAYFEVKKVVGSVYTMGISDSAVAGMKAKTYYVKLQGTADGTTYEDFAAIKVKVTRTKPSVRFSQTGSVNLFYNKGVEAGSNQLKAVVRNADSITLTQAESADPYFRIDKSGSDYRIVLLKNAADNETHNQFLARARRNSKVNVKVHYAGYKDCAEFQDQQITVNVKLQYKAPKIDVEADNTAFYSYLGIRSTAVRFVDKTTKQYLPSSVNVELAEGKNAKANEDFRIEEKNGNVILTLVGNKNGTAYFSLKDADWSEPVIVKQSIKYVTTKPKAVFEKATLNTGAAYVGKEKAYAAITVRNVTDITIRDLFDENGKPNFTGTAKGMDLLNYLDLELATGIDVAHPDKQYLAVSFKKGVTQAKAAGFKGNYVYTASFKLNKMEVKNVRVKISILPETAIALNTKTKGNIDLVNRSATSVEITPVLKGINGTIVGMHFGESSDKRVTGTFAANNLFKISWDNTRGVAVVTAKDGVDLRKGQYNVMPIFEIETPEGIVEVPAKKYVRIRTVQGSVKLDKLSVLALSMTADNVAAQEIKVLKPSGATIKAVSQTSLNDSFELGYDQSSGRISVSIKDAAGLKVGKTYTIKAKLSYEGQASNVNAQSIDVKVTITK